MQTQILDMLLKEDEITWQNILYDLVKTEQMNPWDIDISKLSQEYLRIVKQLKEFNFFISGKVLLAAAILLKMKSNKLLTEDLIQFDQILFGNPDEFIDELNEFEEKNKKIKLMENPRLTIKTPQARKKRVSLKDLINALEKALEVDRKRTLRILESKRIPDNLKVPEKKVDITQKIKELYQKIVNLFSFNKSIQFSQLVNSNKKEDKLFTFIPLLHLANQGKINLEQEEHFGEIYIDLKND